MIGPTIATTFFFYINALWNYPIFTHFTLNLTKERKKYGFNDQKKANFPILLLSVSRFFAECFFRSATHSFIVSFFSLAVSLSLSLSLLVVFVSATQIQFLPFHIIMQILIWLCCKFPPYHRYTDVITVKRGICRWNSIYFRSFIRQQCEDVILSVFAFVPQFPAFWISFFSLCVCVSLSLTP